MFCVVGALGVSLFALAPIHPLLIVVVFLTGFVNIGQVRAQQRNIQFWTQTLPEQRRADRLLRTVIEPQGAPELRVLGASDELADRHRAGYEAALDVDRERERKQIALSLPTSLGEVAALGFGLWLVVGQVRRGEASPGDVALVLMLLQTTTEQLHNVWFTGAWLLQELDAVSRLASLLDYRSPVRTKETAKPAVGLPKKSIRFDNVTFRYPDTDKDVLRGLTMELPAGAVVALVGDNGAGKSTIAKLLARLYDPTDGRVTVDGVDLRDLDLEEWRAGFTGAFQDFARFELQALQTVGIGDLLHAEDRDAVSAAVREGAAQPVVDRLAGGLDAQLGRRWKNGTELSAGQWQKLAIARSRMRAEPRVLVLDEPTAALDPMAEAEIFDRFALMTRAARRKGGVAMIVSHRFSTVRRADLIAVLGDGRLLEFGSHEDLVGRGGTYAELWGIQAANYGR
jgi:ATP-binding cassette subfamily B protein